MISKSELEELYLNQKLKTAVIAKRYGVSPQTVCYWLRKHHIPLRPAFGKGGKRVEYPHRAEFEKWLKLKFRGSFTTWRNLSGLVASYYKKGLLHDPVKFEEYILKNTRCRSRPHYRRAFNMYHEFLREGDYEGGCEFNKA